MMTDTKHTPEQVLAAVRAAATQYGRCCGQYQDSLGGFHCHDCGQRTYAMLQSVQAILGVSEESTMSHEEAMASAILRRAAPDLLGASRAALAYDDAIRACGNDPERMATYHTAVGESLDALYDAWITKARAAVAEATE